MNKNFDNGYVPQVGQPIEDYEDMDLIEVFAKQKALTFLQNPRKYVNHTKVVNFSIINAELSTNTTTAEKKQNAKCFKKQAENIKITDFKNYEDSNKTIAFEGILKSRKSKTALSAEMRVHMKEHIAARNGTKQIFCRICFPRFVNL